MSAAQQQIRTVATALHEIAHQDRGRWQASVHAIEGTKLSDGVSVGTPACAILLTMAAKNVARQMPHIHPSNESEMRGVMQALANVLANELVAAGFEIDEPWWNR